MMAGGLGVIGRAGRMLAGVACLAGLAGCNLRPSAPESRAEYFVEKFIRTPQAADDLRAVTALAAGESPEALAGDPHTRTAIQYLRARERLGAALGFHVSGTRSAAPDRKQVTVTVSEGLAVGGAEAVRLQVELTRRDSDWIVTRLSAD
jgi:hypothetical protein